jgi:hypothetical protein
LVNPHDGCALFDDCRLVALIDLELLVMGLRQVVGGDFHVVSSFLQRCILRAGARAMHQAPSCSTTGR